MSWKDGEVLASVIACGISRGRPLYSCGLYAVYSAKGTGVQKLRKVAAGPACKTVSDAWDRRPAGWPSKQYSGLRNGMTVSELAAIYPATANPEPTPQAAPTPRTSHDRRDAMERLPLAETAQADAPGRNPVDPADVL